jgi:hypothetical protein
MAKIEDRRGGCRPKYTDEDLLNCLKDFYQKNKRVPAAREFTNVSGYPSFSTYRRRFGCWSNALKRMDEKPI